MRLISSSALRRIGLWGGFVFLMTVGNSPRVSAETITGQITASHDDLVSTTATARCADAPDRHDCLSWCSDIPTPREGPKTSKDFSQCEGTIIQNCLFNCQQTNNYSYTFDYQMKRDENWQILEEARKCEEIKLVFSARGGWGGAFDMNCQPNDLRRELPLKANFNSFPMGGMFPTSFNACAGQSDCLSKAVEHQTMKGIWSKGTQRVPENFMDATQKSLASPNPYLKCQEGVCTAYADGEYLLTAKAPASAYYGQCRGYGLTFNTAEKEMPAIQSNVTTRIANFLPAVTVNLNKDPAQVGEEVEVACDAVDSDTCSDKIAKIKWNCTDSNGKSDNCYFYRDEIVQWDRGALNRNISEADQANPYRATVKFKASAAGAYAITCEAVDNDPVKPGSEVGIDSLSVLSEDSSLNSGNGGVIENNTGNKDQSASSNSSDETRGVGIAPAQFKYCALLSEQNEKNITVCPGKNGEVKLKAYFSGMKPLSFNWSCGESFGVVKNKLDSSVICVYPMPASGGTSHLPSLSINYRGGGNVPEKCVTLVNVDVSSQCGESSQENAPTENSDNQNNNNQDNKIRIRQ